MAVKQVANTLPQRIDNTFRLKSDSDSTRRWLSEYNHAYFLTSAKVTRLDGRAGLLNRPALVFKAYIPWPPSVVNDVLLVEADGGCGIKGSSKGGSCIGRERRHTSHECYETVAVARFGEVATHFCVASGVYPLS